MCGSMPEQRAAHGQGRPPSPCQDRGGGVVRRLLGLCARGCVAAALTRLDDLLWQRHHEAVAGMRYAWKSCCIGPRTRDPLPEGTAGAERGAGAGGSRGAGALRRAAARAPRRPGAGHRAPGRDLLPGQHGMAGPRFFGFVIGGSLPVTVAANWLATAWDQNAGVHGVARPPRSSRWRCAGSSSSSACPGTRRGLRHRRHHGQLRRSPPRGTRCWRRPAGMSRRTGSSARRRSR